MLKNIFAILLTIFAASLSINSVSSIQGNPELSTTELVEKIQEKILSVPEMDNWQASVLTTLFDMDKNWEPKKKTIIEKLIIVENKKRTEKILSAIEYDEDKTKDMTSKYQAEAAKFNKKNQAEQGDDGKRKGGRHRSLDLKRDELFPFGENKRQDYEFDLREGSLAEGQRVYILETRSLQKSADYFEGKYYFQPETFDVLRAELRPAKFPGPLKLLEMHIDFDRLPEGHLVIRTAKVRIHVGLIIKNIRMESEEIYSDYKVFE